ncbi:MAG: TRAP transporter permease [Deltaproteobacteria bacterium]|nr:TRAP transporter permease [Deltaproteobacteria bacterium]
MLLNARALKKLISQKVAKQRDLRKGYNIAAYVMAVGAAAVHLYSVYHGLYNPRMQRSIHLMFMLPLAFFLFPARNTSPKDRPSIPDIMLALLAVVVSSLGALELDRLENRWIFATDLLARELIFGTVNVLLILEATRRTVSSVLTYLAIGALIYLPLGPYLPGILKHDGFPFQRMVEMMYLDTDQGIYGMLTGVSATYVILFVLFGAFILYAGAGVFFTDFATAVAGRSRGGPAKIAVVSSGMFGTMTGIAVANVYATGSVTIPLMIRTGYRPSFAGAVEAAASTGGQYMPPVMGAAAFVMAEITGISYYRIALGASISAVLYFVAVGAMVHFEALRTGLAGVPEQEIPKFRKVLAESYLFSPVVFIVYLLLNGYSPMKAAFYAILISMLTSYFRRETWMTPRKILLAMNMGARNTVMVAMACACAGMIVAVMTHTGLGLSFSSMIIASSGGVLLIALFLVMIVSLILGVGLPTTAAYVLTAALAAPALERMGVDQLAAHLFVFYFAIIACVTPPVSICAYAGAGVADADPVETGFTAAKLAVAGFIVPYMFVYNPSLVTHGTLSEIFFSSITALFGVVILAGGLQGWLLSKTGAIEKWLVVAAGLAMVIPHIWVSLFGFLLTAGVVSRQWHCLRTARSGT